MSSAPCTLGTITTSSRAPMAGTRVVRSSRAQGLSRALTRVHSWVRPPGPPRSAVSEAIRTSPSRAATLASDRTPSSRLPSSTSTWPTSAGTLAAILALDGSRKWMARLGREGTSRSGAGAPTASGRKKSLALREGMGGRYPRRPWGRYDALLTASAPGARGVVTHDPSGRTALPILARGRAGATTISSVCHCPPPAICPEVRRACPPPQPRRDQSRRAVDGARDGGAALHGGRARRGPDRAGPSGRGQGTGPDRYRPA